MTVTTRFLVAGDSDMGRVRQNNEDNYFIDPELGIFLVVDGVGGQAAGEEAAAAAVATISGRLRRQVGSIESRIREAITLANNEILARANQNPSWFGMACVLTVAVVENNSLVIGHVGDTRLYKIQHGTIRKITSDHSPVGEREDAGELDELEAMRHPRRNEVYRDVGTEPHDTHDEAFIQILKAPFEADSAWVMCSDGLSDLVTSGDIRRIVESYAGDLPAVVRSLIDAANQAGGKDNITVIYVEGEQFARISTRSGPVRTAVYNESEIITGGLEDQRGAQFFRKHIPGTAMAGKVEQSSLKPSRQPMAAPASYNQMAATGDDVGFGKILFSRAAFLIYGMIGAAVLLILLQWGLGVKLPGASAPEPIGPKKLPVGPEAEFKSIAAAMEKAMAGDTIEVAENGTGYIEHIELKEGVSLVSKKAGGAVLYAPREGEHAGIAVSAVGLGAGKISGLKIIGTSDYPLSIGIKLDGSSVEIEDTEILKADTAAIAITGADSSRLRANYIHEFKETGVLVAGDQARSELSRNVIVNRESQDRAGKSAIKVEGKPQIQIEKNIMHDGEDVTGLEGESKNEVRLKNYLIPKGKQEGQDTRPERQPQPSPQNGPQQRPRRR